MYTQDEEYILSVYAQDVNGNTVDGEVNIFGGSHPPQFTKEVYQATITEEVSGSQEWVVMMIVNPNSPPPPSIHPINPATGWFVFVTCSTEIRLIWARNQNWSWLLIMKVEIFIFTIIAFLF